MSRFLEHAIELLEGAERSVAAGEGSPEWTILISATGAVQMLAGSDWPLESLRTDRGASMAFRISRQRGGVRLEGRAGSRRCLLETAQSGGTACPPPAGIYLGLLRPTVVNPDLPAATLRRPAPATRD